MRELAAAALLLSGVAFVLIAAIGLQRFPDVFARMHAATKAATLGLVLVLAGTGLRVESADDLSKLALVGILMFVTAPIGAHMVGRAAYRSGTELNPGTVIDELAGSPAEQSGTPGNQELSSKPDAG
ncbi:MAG TPA: monovalent cation/H(+) antiporter subunit G [Actinomycetota bacterium]|nr:monovalent cation/H(+) antiporter subunit G [Actinomycetota bacterium]